MPLMTVDTRFAVHSMACTHIIKLALLGCTVMHGISQLHQFGHAVTRSVLVYLHWGPKYNTISLSLKQAILMLPRKHHFHKQSKLLSKVAKQCL